MCHSAQPGLAEGFSMMLADTVHQPGLAGSFRQTSATVIQGAPTQYRQGAPTQTGLPAAAVTHELRGCVMMSTALGQNVG